MGIATPSAARGVPTARRVGVTVTCLVAATLGSTGCGASFGAQSQQQYQPAVGISDRTGNVYAVNTLVVTDGDGNGTVVCSLINQTEQADTLTSVSAVDAGGHGLGVEPLPSSGLDLAPGQAVQLANSGAVRLSDPGLVAGSVLTLTFTFTDAAPLQVETPVVNQTSTYADVPVGPTAIASSPAS